MKKSNKNVIFVQYGDFRDAFTKFKYGIEETYRDQKKSVGFVESLSDFFNITVISFSEEPYSEYLSHNLFAIGVVNKDLTKNDIRKIFDETSPQFSVIRTPNIDFLKESTSRNIATLPNFADIFINSSIKSRYFNYKISKVLKHPYIYCCSNHSVNASRSVVDVLGLPAERVVPWDWERLTVSDRVKLNPRRNDRFSIFFAGLLAVDKGVGDCIQAVSILRKQGIEVRLSFAGPGDLDKWQSFAYSLGVAEQVSFLGTISHRNVRNEMQTHDAVIVPSRHSYAEGLPNTIYEALASRSPLIISDHPAFHDRLRDGQDCLVFRAGKPVDLAMKIARLVQDTSIYRTLSINSANAHEKLYVGLEWEDLISKFLEDPKNKYGWVELNSISNFL